MKSRGLLVSLIGIDGTGKTTLARRLTQNSMAEGVALDYVAARFAFFTWLKAVPGAVKALLGFSGKTTDYSPQGVTTKERLFSNRFLAGIYLLLVLLDYLPQLMVKVWIPLVKGRNLCCDRYIYDTAVDLVADLGWSERWVLRLLGLLLWIAPRPNRVYLLDLPAEVAYRRNLPKGDYVPLWYLQERRRLYLGLLKLPEVELLDGGGDPHELETVIRRGIARLSLGAA